MTSSTCRSCISWRTRALIFSILTPVSPPFLFFSAVARMRGAGGLWSLCQLAGRVSHGVPGGVYAFLSQHFEEAGNARPLDLLEGLEV